MSTREPLSHIAQPVPELPVTDVERAQHHYRDVLGFDIAWLDPDKEIGAVSRGNAAIFLRKRAQPFEPGVNWVSAMDVDATYDELRVRGANIVEPLENRPWGLRQFAVEDLDGNRFYFHTDQQSTAQHRASTLFTAGRNAEQHSGSPVPSESRRLLQHFLAALAYRTQKALRHAPPSFAEFDVGGNVRTPHEILWHMTGVIGYARTMLRGGSFEPSRLETFEAEVNRFHDTLRDLSDDLADSSLQARITDEQFLHGPLSDAMTHVGQLAMMRRMHGSPIASENFIYAAIDATNVSAAQAKPRAPDRRWAPHLPPPAPGPNVKYTRPLSDEVRPAPAGTTEET
jgi:catechol 2,3-dioxygenase-like lactoylglutathione lyase family enzyme